MIILIYHTLSLLVIIAYGESKVVTTTLGPVKGKLVDDVITGALYYSFEGMKYAEAPVGNLRFKPPVQKIRWNSIFDATKPGAVCPQPEIFYTKAQMSEDCLNFNVYTPANYLNKLLPVMAYVHTGDFIFNSGNAEPLHGPEFLILNNIVVVTLNYRLGALGFLSLCTNEASGNAGIKDVLLALKIIKKNIERFGGDPNKITLAGNGAGAAIVNYILLTNKSTGLFHNVMIHSASVLSERSIQLNPKENAILLGKKLGFEWKDDNSLLRMLQKENPHTIVDAEKAISEMDPQRGFRMYYPFKPTVEIDSDTAIITKLPLELIKNGEIQDVPIFIGFNNQEGLEMFLTLKSEPELIKKLNQNFELCVPADIKYPYGSEARKKLAARIKKFYFNGEDISFVNVQKYLNMVSDATYTYSIDYFIKLFKEHKKAPVHYYVFEVDDALNWCKIFANITYPGSAHDDDIGYVFLTSQTKPIYQQLEPSTKHLQETVMHNIKHFMSHGTPTPNSNVNCWPEAGVSGFHLRQGSSNIPVFHRPIPERIEFWYSVYEEYFNNYSLDDYKFCTKTANHSVTYG